MRYLVLTLCLAATACATFPAQYACRRADPEPHAALLLLGLAGGIWLASDPAHQAWQADIDRCVAEKMAQRE